MDRIDIVQRYRQLRGIAAEIQNAALGLVPDEALVEFGRRIGGVRKRTLALDDDEMMLVEDLAIHTARNGRSRAIDRYARAAKFAQDSDQARILEALCNARFTVFEIEGTAMSAGVMIRDLRGNGKFHLMDLGIAMSAKSEALFVGRLMEIEGFVMSCITCLPLQEELARAVIPRLPPRGIGSGIEELQHPRCAIAVYRAAIELNWMQRCISLPVNKAAPIEHPEAA
jgi:hypothetical protein